ncbi:MULTISPECIES: antirestriction protein [unclassified Aureimonas]|uniref:antirestriction protein n=1 Tax=unclassified Aureimonas TaxID=2615206 RepID=UPI0006F2E86B|nr:MULTISPECIES: antirestriction protein [unclassified Aureimonas]KQT62080.1 antirestriction protein [Aureimonas sp. Leaf427]KQT72340.1 antirestriction protein [Aureimonas sp. Leaf460]
MTASASVAVNVPLIADLVSDERRMDFLPALFGLPLLIVGEHTVYHFLDRLSPDYGGGFWDFLERDGTPLYLRPASDGRFRIHCTTNDYEGEVSADAAGIIATLFAFSHLSFRDRSDRMANAYARLYAFAADHAEARAILGAID